MRMRMKNYWQWVSTRLVMAGRMRILWQWPLTLLMIMPSSLMSTMSTRLVYSKPMRPSDIGCEVLDNCATNARLNSSLLNFHEAAVRVRELDWKEPWPPTFDSSSQQRSEYSWGSSEIEEAEGATLLLAADVVYNDQLTDSFFSILEKLMARGPKKVLYMALEKRYNFTLDDLDVVANGYQHFRSFLRDDQGCEGLDERLLPCFRGKQIDLAGVPQYIREYERGKDVELWKVLYMALEKRYNFTLDDLDVVANGYQHFRSFLRDDQGCEGLDERLLPCFKGKQIDLAGVPRYIREYEKGKDVELWKANLTKAE